MNRFKLIFILLFLIGGSSIECLEKKDYQVMKTSIIVPCYYKHFALVYELLDYYKNQTVLPDEVIISLSESHKVSQEQIQNIESEAWPFLVKVICNQSKMSAGQNRNIACEHSSGDLIICQDADDIPHPQRVEIIKYLFENYEIDHLIHMWIPPGKSFSTYQLDELESLSLYFAHFDDTHKNLPTYNGHCGNVALTRSVFTAIKWPEYFQIGEDVDFDKSVYSRFQFKVVIKIPLVIYRKYLSSFDNP